MGKLFAIGSKDQTNNLCYIFTKSGNHAHNMPVKRVFNP